MIDRVSSDKLDEAIDFFETSWTPDSRQQIRALLAEFGLESDVTALTELVRIDIELRYKQGAPILLEECLSDFDELQECPECVAQIAFEDFRLRSAHGHRLSVSRWGHLPGVKEEAWFQQLAGEQSVRRDGSDRRPRHRAAERSIDAACEEALEAIGFRFVSEIGQGAFSRVYLATQSELANRYVVLKVVSQPLAEPQSMAMLQHTNIVPIYSFHRFGSRCAICMPYAGSVTLADFLKDRQRSADRSGQCLVTTVRSRVESTMIHVSDGSITSPPASNLQIPAADERAVLRPLEQLHSLSCNELATWVFARLAAALAHSHARGILHGDLKPANVLIRNDGEPALLDFNLSHSLEADRRGHVGGTLPYMSPESYRLLMGQQVAINAASDIYSLGVMLFEFVTGRLPFSAPHSSAAVDLELAIDARKRDPDWRSDDDVAPSLRSIINRALAYCPQDRYESADHIQQDLEFERRHQSLVYAVEPRRIRVKKWFRRHPSLTSAGSVGVMLLAMLIPALWLAVAWRDQSLRMASVAQFAAFETESAAALSAAMADPLRNQADQVLETLVPLEKFGVLEDGGLGKFGWESLPADEAARQREILLRHVIHLGYAESALLQVDFQTGPLNPVQLQRLDRLIAAMERIRGQHDSRACLFLKANRARLAGQEQEYNSQVRAAQRFGLSNDSETYLEAVRLVSERNWRGAITLLTGLADRNSVPSALRWTMLGYSQYELGNYEDAKISYTQSIERAPNSSRLRLRRGRCYYKLGEGARAEADFTRALELEPELAAAWANRGLIRLARGRTQAGLADVTTALQHDPGNPQFLLMRSRAYRNLGKQEDADRDFAAAIDSNVLTPSSLIARASARKQFDPEGALSDLKIADAMDPGNRIILTNMANVLANKLDRREEAIAVLRRVSEIEPEFERAIIDRAVLLAQMGQFDEAHQEMAAALVAPNAARTLYQAACVCALSPGMQNHVRALSYLSMAIREGYDADNLANDVDLESLRTMEGFAAVRRVYQLSRLAGSANRSSAATAASDQLLSPEENL